jgi:hypothetical protein
MDLVGFAALFCPDGAALDDETWIARANQSITPCLAALNARFERGSSEEKTLDASYEPGPAARNFIGVSGGGIAEMLDQAATHCGTFMTSLACPTVSLNTSVFRAATAPHPFTDQRGTI